MKQDLLFVSAILILSIVISLPIFAPGFYTIHDDQQFARLFELDKSLKSGQIPPRWVQDLGFGFGYPLFIFYPPLVYLFGESFHLIGFGFINSIKLVYFISIFGSGLAMYILIRSYWGHLAALVASLFYIFAPYRALDIYVRGALAEAFSFVWLPLVIWSFRKLALPNESKFIFPAGVFLALLMITHNLILLPFLLFLSVFLAFLLFKVQEKIKFLFSTFLAITFGLSLSAFFWMPSLLEKKYTIVDQLLTINLASYKIHFVYPHQLWNWPWGFGGSAPGLSDGISFKVGKIHIIVSVLALALAILHLVKDKVKTKISSEDFQTAILFFVLFIFSIFMTTFYSKPIWDYITPLWYLQFPWRFLVFTALFTSILAGSLVNSLKVPIFKIFFSIILMIVLIIPNLKLFRPQYFRHGLTDSVVTSKDAINWDVSLSSFEYLPIGVDLEKTSLGTNTVKISKNQIPQNRIEVLEGSAHIEILENTPSKLTFRIQSEAASKIKANIFNFPRWELKIDERKSDILDNNGLKLITFNVPQGFHTVNIEFKNTLVRTFSNLITIMALFLLVLFLTFKNKRTVRT